MIKLSSPSQHSNIYTLTANIQNRITCHLIVIFWMVLSPISLHTYVFLFIVPNLNYPHFSPEDQGYHIRILLPITECRKISQAPLVLHIINHIVSENFMNYILRICCNTTIYLNNYPSVHSLLRISW